MKISFLFILIISLFTACESKDDDQVIIDTAIELSVENKEGTDLLNPENPNSFTEEDITIYYLIDGKKKEVYKTKMDHSDGFMIYEHESEHRIRVFPNKEQSEETPVTYIQWKDNDLDTIECQIERKENMTACSRVWWNGDLKWKKGDKTERLIKIVNPSWIFSPYFSLKLKKVCL